MLAKSVFPQMSALSQPFLWGLKFHPEDILEIILKSSLKISIKPWGKKHINHQIFMHSSKCIYPIHFQEKSGQHQSYFGDKLGRSF